MLLFYEHEPDSAPVTTSPPPADPTPPIQTINPLPQYPSHAFIPYLPPSQPSSQPSSSPTTTQPPLLTLHNTSTWTYSGPLLLPSSTSLPPSFHTWSNRTISTPSHFLTAHLLPLLSFLHSFLSAAGAQHYWLTLRASRPTTEYDTPRWHVDENFFTPADAGDVAAGGTGIGFSASSKGVRAWKLAATLLGPGTLFIQTHDQDAARRVLHAAKAVEREKMRMDAHTCSSIRCVGCATYADCVRERLASSLSDTQIETPAYGEVAFLRIGGEEGAVHSEPKCDVDRIFVNVVPGTEGDLRELMGRWGMGFPRAWCFGVPVGFVGSDEGEGFRGVGMGGGGLDDREGRGEGEEVRKSTMRANMGEEYRGWLEDRGFEVAQVFG